MKVLLGVGGSPDSLEALPRVVERVARVGDELAVAVLENPASPPTPADVESRVREELTDSEVVASVRMVTGHPGSRLVEIAETEGFDVIALGGGERTPMGKISLGDIAEYVLLNARTSVFLVR